MGVGVNVGVLVGDGFGVLVEVAGFLLGTTVGVGDGKCVVVGFATSDGNGVSTVSLIPVGEGFAINLSSKSVFKTTTKLITVSMTAKKRIGKRMNPLCFIDLSWNSFIYKSTTYQVSCVDVKIAS